LDSCNPARLLSVIESATVPRFMILRLCFDYRQNNISEQYGKKYFLPTQIDTSSMKVSVVIRNTV